MDLQFRASLVVAGQYGRACGENLIEKRALWLPCWAYELRLDLARILVVRERVD